MIFHHDQLRGLFNSYWHALGQGVRRVGCVCLSVCLVVYVPRVVIVLKVLVATVGVT